MIKFRILDQLSDRRCQNPPYGERYSIDTSGNLISPTGEVCDKMHKIELFSGVLDKNGVEIYEGDAVSYKVGGTIFYGTVYYDTDQLGWYIHNTDDSFSPLVKYLDYQIHQS